MTLVRTLRRHWLLAALLTVGGALRLVTWLAYQPALLYIDSFRYLANVIALLPNQLNPIGYDLVLDAFLGLSYLGIGGLALVSAVQHLLGLALAVAVYLLARRLGARRWLAALGTAPLLLDAYQLQIEQAVMSEVWFDALLVGLLWLLLTKPVTWRRAGVAGVLIGAGVLLRLIGITVAAPVAVFLVVAGNPGFDWRVAARRLGAAAVGLVVVLLPYATYFKAVTGAWGLSISSANVLYGRTAAVADCSKLTLSAPVRLFCPVEPLDERKGVDIYAHMDGTVGWPGHLPPGMNTQQGMKAFSHAVLKAQPLDVAGAVLTDFGKAFAWTKATTPGDVPIDRWQFQLGYPVFYGPPPEPLTQLYDGMDPKVNFGLAEFLRSYQLSVGYTPGPVLALGGALGVFTLFRKRSGLRCAALLTAGSAFVLLFGSAAFEFSWRYQLPALVLLPFAGVLGLTTNSTRRKLAPYPDDVDARAVSAFRQTYGQRRFSELTVVIAAYNEGDGIGEVLARMPSECCGMRVDVVVVVDGATDNTAAAADLGGAFVCVAPKNRGQGAALRLGYHLAAEGGAKYVVSTDADGQYENDEMERLVRPLVADEADFVSGSRRLGSEQAADRARWLGVRVFAALASVLTARRITDTSFGFRGMRSEFACAVTLREPQYQSSELMLGMIGRGARVLEVPASMRFRKAGSSKKGSTIPYGANYARVMLTTWFREFVVRRGKRSGRATRI